MKIQKTLLCACLLASGHARALDRNLVIDAGGDMRIEMSIPADDDVDQTTPITKGRIEIAPVLFAGGLGVFSLNQLSLTFGDFEIERRPFGNHRFREVGVHLSGATTIVAAQPVSQPGIYMFTLPPDAITFYGAAFVNDSDGGDLFDGRDQPSTEVTGILNLNQRTFSATVKFLKHREVLGIDLDALLTINITALVAPHGDKDLDGVLDFLDTCLLTANPRVRDGLGQWVQPPVASPVVTPPGNINSTTCALGQAGNGTAVDVCEGLWTTLASDAPGTYGVGTTTVTWTATTPIGRVGTAMQSVSVVDRTPPALSAPPAVTFPQCQPASLGVATALDDCAGREVVIANNAPPRFPLGRTIVTWSATDRAGNRATAPQVVTVTTCGALP